MKKRRRWGLLKGVFAAAAVLSLFLFFGGALNNLAGGQEAEGRQQLEEALRRAAVACYAVEGVYPPTLEYLIEHYGVQIERDRYTVFYENFADNLMPEITVLDRNA